LKAFHLLSEIQKKEGRLLSTRQLDNILINVGS